MIQKSTFTHSAQQESLIKGNAAIARADAAVQTRAYELYELRGRRDGRAEEDWYQAEADLREAQHVGDPKCRPEALG